MKARQPLSHIRALCALGLGGEATMPALIDALHALVPHHAAAFIWVDREAHVKNIYDAGSIDRRLLTLYAAEYCKQPRTAYGRGFMTAMRTFAGVHELPDWGEFYQTDLYNIIWRDFAAHHAIQAIIRDSGGWEGTAIGALVLWRAANEPAFTREDKRRLADLIPAIAHGLYDRHGGAPPGRHGAQERGMLILDRGSARIVHACADARKLMALAGSAHVEHIRVARDAPGEAIAPMLDELRRRAIAMLAGRSGVPPMLQVVNPWGRFVLRGFPLASSRGATNGLIGVFVERHEPLPVRVWRRLSDRGLTETQERVCVMLAQGLSRGEIARRLDVSAHTAIDHIRTLYRKLDVRNRDQMIEKVLGKNDD
jgi:DNA-binding CsgD family transcriptional regulator